MIENEHDEVFPALQSINLLIKSIIYEITEVKIYLGRLFLIKESKVM